MTYLALARKWRPHSFAELVGQDHVRQALVNALASGRIHPAYLFTGTRGVGKTTLARLVAKCLNCEQGITATPCGKCQACQEIDAGRFIDLIEVDAASRTKVEDTRELLENVQYAPVHGRYKVYLIDEVHMLSGHSFNALLKTLEEPPAHVQFLLATTDPKKIPATILSRCIQFGLKRIPEIRIADHLHHILELESLTGETAALRLLATAADGSLRDALSLLDQAIAFGDGVVRETDVRSMLGSIPRESTISLLQALAHQDGAKLLEETARISVSSGDFSALLSDVLNMLHQIAIRQIIPQAVEEDPMIGELARTIGPEDIQLYYQIALLGQRDLSYADSPRNGFEMILLRMLAFRPQSSTSHAANPGSTPPARQLAKRSAGLSLDAPDPSAPLNDYGHPATSPRDVTTQNLPLSRQEIVGNSSRQPDSLTGSWEKIASQLALSGMAKQLAFHSNLELLAPEHYCLYIDKAHEQLCTDRTKNRLLEALQEFVGSSIKIDFKIVDDLVATPAAKQKQLEEQCQHAAETAIEADETIGLLRTHFGAEIIPGSIKSIQPQQDKSRRKEP